MIILILPLLILCCIYKKHYKNFKVLHISIIIWTIIAVTTILFRPIINKNTSVVTTKQYLNPIPNDLDPTEINYVINDDDKIYYKTNKLHYVIADNNVNIIDNNNKENYITMYYEKNSNLWFFLTLNKYKRLIKTEIIL